MTNQLKLGDVASVVMGQAPPGKDCNRNGMGEPFVKAGEFRDAYPVVREWTTAPTKRAQSGDVLVCVVGATAGKINLGIDCVIGRSVAAVRPVSSRLDTHYLYHFLVTKTRVLRAGSQGMAQGVITRDMLMETEIPLPPLEEQRRIAAILDKGEAIKALFAKRERAFHAVEESLFAALHDGGDRDVAGRTYSFSDVYWLQEGPGVRNWQFTASGVKLLNVGNITIDGRVDLQRTERHVSEEEAFGRYSHFWLTKEISLCLPREYPLMRMASCELGQHLLQARICLYA